MSRPFPSSLVPWVLGLAFLATGLCAPSHAQKGLLPGLVEEQNMASAQLYSRVEGAHVQVVLRIAIDDGWHLYHDDLGNPDAIGLPTKVGLSAENVTFGRARFPTPDRLDQEGLGTWIYGHGGTIVVHALGVVDDAARSIGPVSATLEGLTCEDRGQCVPYAEEVDSLGPGDDALFADFPVDELLASHGDEPPAARAAAAAGPSIAERPDADWDAVEFAAFEPRIEAPQHSLVVWLLLAFVAGMILNVMPCVLPVISIKVLSFVQQAGEDKRRVLHLGLAFAAGIVAVFLVLATLAAAVGLSWGEQFQSQGFLITMVAIVFAFALSLFGVFELGVPVAVGQLAGSYREGLGDAFAKGALATVLATPCSGPFLGSTLTWTLAQPPVTIYAIFLFLGLGMALPYVVLTANPKLLKLVPRPGPWMDTFKQSMGFVLLATVIYLLISVRQDMLLYTAAFLLFVGLACWAWGRFATWEHSRPRRLAVLGIALLVAGGGARLSFVEFRGMFEHDSDAPWVEFDPEVFQAALDEGRSTFVDFTANWCPNCKWNEKWVFDSPAALERTTAKNVLRMKADMTHRSEYTSMLTRLRNSLGGSAIPFMALFPGDDPLRPHVRYDIVSRGDFLELLDSLPDPAPEAVRQRM